MLTLAPKILTARNKVDRLFKGMEHVPNIFMSFDKYFFLN